MALRANRKARKLNPGVYARPDGKLQAHLQVPEDVRFAFGGKCKLVRSLGTDDPAQANRAHAQLVAKQEAAYDLLRRGTASKAFEDFARRLHASQLDYIDQQNDLAAFDGYATNAFLQQTFGHRLNSTDPGELAATVGWAADWFFAEQTGIDPENLSEDLRASRPYCQVLRECAEVLKDSYRSGREAAEGRTVSPPRHPALAAKPRESADGNKATDERATMTVSDYFEKTYLPAKAKFGETQIKNLRQTVGLFKELVGDPPLYLLTRAQITDFQELLTFIPDGRMRTGDLAKTPLIEIVGLQRDGKLNLKRPAATTVDKHVGNIRQLLVHAFKKGHIKLNPAFGMENVAVTVANPVIVKRPFTREEIEAIFALPIFAGCEGDTERGRFRPGPVKIRDERFWVPILLFLTGARAAEVAGLEKSDVKIEDGKARIVFRYSDLRRLKNPESERVIPLHPWAIKMGFGDYVANLPDATPYLFPDIVTDSRDSRSGEMTEVRLNGSAVFRQFNRTHLKHVGLADDESVSLHSFRHVFEDAMTGLDIPEEAMFRLTGRSVGGSRKRYARSLPANEERRDQRAEDYMRHVERINFGGLSISHLFVS